ncbi:MAG: SDR family NAD(P)-dependent oxidoreductase [Rhodobacteraceae bacterium]|nr:SDR family NAD(P)-dependent oxidoreductase [Paracoccaceae bacterium]
MADIAIIGYAARLPGAETAAEAWEVIRSGRCVISEVPESRWSSDRFLGTGPGRSVTRRAGVLDDPFGFDAAFFGISPAEAVQMDPQQRILLETVARAFDHAGCDPARLDRDAVGVFIGASAADHSTLALQDPAAMGPRFMLGNTLSILANRISQHLDFRGPSLTVDTACSSSLVALHQARQALETGEIETAVVGGVNLLLSPIPFVGFSQAGMLSPSGQCRPFAAGADGYLRAEGAVVVLLQRMEVARRLAVGARGILCATATNSDGAGTALAHPSRERQAALVASTLAAAGASPEDLAFVEAHGTGTAVGDPIEAAALGQSLGQNRSMPLPLGAAKAHFGHLEPAAGLVGLIKAQLTLENGILPGVPHATQPNPAIDFAAHNLDLPDATRALPERQSPWLAGVSAFGFGGVNAHAVIRQPDLAPGKTHPVPPMPKALLLTAATRPALESMARDWQQVCRNEGADLSRAVAAANRCLPRHRLRMCLPAGDAGTLRASLAQATKGSGVPRAANRPEPMPVVFVFCGNGALWRGMARETYRNDPVFRRVFRRVARHIVAAGGVDITSRLLTTGPSLDLTRAEVAQPLLFALQVALCRALAAKGLRPAAVLGHSMGEVAAAVVVGALSESAGAKVVASRAAAFAPLRGTGAMAVLAASRGAVENLIQTQALPVAIAAENAPDNVTVSGEPCVVEALLQAAKSARIAARRLPVPYAYHNPMLAPPLHQIVGPLAGIKAHVPQIPFYSGWQGQRFKGAPTAGYWGRNALEPVAFRQTVEALAGDGFELFVEVSPKAVLAGSIRDTLEQVGASGQVIAGLSQTDPPRNPDEIARDVIAAGGALDEAAMLGERPATMPDLPPYPFDRKDYRFEPTRGADLFGQRPPHGFLGARQDAEHPCWSGHIARIRRPWLGDHRIGGRALFPATAVLETLAAAARECEGGTGVELRDVDFLQALEVPDDHVLETRTRFDAPSRRLTFETGRDGTFTTIARASVLTASPARTECLVAGEGEPTDELYTALASAGMDYGSAFRGLSSVRCEGSRAFGRIDLPPNDPELLFDPCAADAGLHAVAAIIGQGRGGALIPTGVERVRMGSPGRIAGVEVTVRRQAGEGVVADIRFSERSGRVFLWLDGLRLRPMPSPKPEPDLWDEIEVPVAGGTSPFLGPVIRKMALQDDAKCPENLLREALGARLAWDASNRLGNLSTGKCPWPEANTILRAIAEAAPGASDLLWTGLAAVEGAGGRPTFDLVRAASAVLDGAKKGAPRRILLVGDVPPSLAAAARRHGAHLTIVPEQGAGPHRARSELGRVRLAALGDLRSTRFDLVVGLGLSRWASAETREDVARIAARSVETLCLEGAPDELGQIGQPDAFGCSLTRLEADFRASGLDLERTVLESSPGVVALHRKGSAAEPNLRALDIRGTGPLAEGLRRVTEAGEGAIPVWAVEGDGIAAVMAGILNQCREKRPCSPIWLLACGGPEADMLFAWRRVLANESGCDMRAVIVSGAVAHARLADLISRSEEVELRVTPEGAFTPRIVPKAEREPSKPEGRWKLSLARRNLRLEGFTWEIASRRAPGPGEVEIEVTATALNFRDVMLAQGLLPPEMVENGYLGTGLGMECTGHVLRAGPDTGLQVGQPVACIAPDAFASHVTVPEGMVLALPPDVTPQAGGTLPVAFLTADYALTELARLTRGEIVLIHGAAGGVGFAAVQIARAADAKVIATAGSPEKRRFLRALGIDHVADSRSGAVEDLVRNVTEGRGVDVVLNSLSGEGGARSLAYLGPFGRFVELGKRDFAENAPLHTRALRRNVSYFALDLDEVLAARPEVLRPVLARLAKNLTEKRLQPLPFRAFPAEDVGEAFRLMRDAGHIGKVIVEPPREPVPQGSSSTLDFYGNWLITGGTSGVGLAVAEWLADKGATRLWLIGRSGQADGSALDHLRRTGVSVEVRTCDVADAAAMDALAEEIAENGGLSGAVHCAGVYDDAPLDAVDAERIARVLAPKVAGACNMDRLARCLDPRHLWFFGSVSARIGTPGQGAYAAANAFMEGLAKRRWAEGLPALAIAFGPIADVGLLSRDPELRERLGVWAEPMTVRQALDRLEEVLRAEDPGATLTIAPMRWARLRQDLPVLAGPLFELMDLPERAESLRDLRALIADLGPKEARGKVLAVLQEELGRLLRQDPAEIDVHRRLSEIGVDSLAAMSFRLSTEEVLGADLALPGLEALTLGEIARLIVAPCHGPDEAERLARQHLAMEDSA